VKSLLIPFVAVVLLGSGADEMAGQAATGLGGGQDTLVITPDAELRQLASALLPELAERSGLALRGPVRIERRSRAQLEAFLIRKLAEELTPERESGLVQGYTLLGLVPEGFSMRETLLEVYTEQVAGFYDPETQTLYVLDDQPRAELESLLLHELVHAVQDQWVKLDSVTAVELGNDRTSAAHAAIEGHATLVMFEYMMNAMNPGAGVDMVQIPDFQALFGPALDGIQDQYPALAGAPRIIQNGLLLPYLEGASFVQAVWATRGDREAPFGALLPTSTEQVANPNRFVAPQPDHPTEVSIEPVGSGASGGFSEVLGFAETRVLLEELVGSQAGNGAAGWDGDRWMLIDQAGSTGLVWAVVFDAVAPRDRFIGLLTPALGAFPAPATLEPIEVSGRPMVVLRVGTEVEVGVTLTGGDEGNDNGGER